MGLFRTLLAISVLITHSGPIFGVRLLNGDMAITLFFMVSGFLMSLILTEKYASVGRFYLNRLLRIFPPFWFAVIFTIALGALANSDPYRDAVASIARYAEAGNVWAIVYAAIANTLLIGADFGRRLGSPDLIEIVYSVAGRPPNVFSKMLFVPQSWTLPIELGFYLLAPFILRLRTATIFALCVCLLLASRYVARTLSHEGLSIDTDALFPFQFQWFLFGVLAYRLYAYLRSSLIQSRGVCWTLSIVAFAIVAFGYPALKMADAEPLALYVLAALALPFLFALSNGNAIDAFIGEMSYPIYLLHLAIAKVLVAGGAERWSIDPRLWGAATLVLTVVVSVVYIFMVDRRVEAIRARIAARDRGRPPIAESVLPASVASSPVP
jgi:peptidoglycan/LPS O-acetylase OafA/YrhL